jgi:hypothetical protein
MNIFARGSSQLQDYITHNLPAGHDTLWGWVAKWSPEELAGMVDPVSRFACETRELQARSAAEGYSVVDVDAPRALRDLGLTKVPAFDTQLLFMASRS